MTRPWFRINELKPDPKALRSWRRLGRELRRDELLAGLMQGKRGALAYVQARACRRVWRDLLIYGTAPKQASEADVLRALAQAKRVVRLSEKWKWQLKLRRLWMRLTFQRLAFTVDKKS